MTVSAFPLLLSFPMLGVFVIRLALGLVFIQLGYTIAFRPTKNESSIISVGWLTLLIGIFLIIGLFTQVAALLAGLFALIAIIIKIRAGHALQHGASYYFLLLAVALSLLFLGPGAFAIDLPL